MIFKRGKDARFGMEMIFNFSAKYHEKIKQKKNKLRKMN